MSNYIRFMSFGTLNLANLSINLKFKVKALVLNLLIYVSCLFGLMVVNVNINLKFKVYLTY